MRDLTQRAGMPMPKLYVTPDLQPNAFATGRNPEHAAVAVTQGILADAAPGTSCAGCWPTSSATSATATSSSARSPPALAMAITFIARLAASPASSAAAAATTASNVIELLALVILAPLAAVLLQMALSRSREYEADRSGARLIGDGEPLARALAKLEARRPGRSR